MVLENAFQILDLIKLDALIGGVTRLVEESGVHSWAIYPTTYEDGGKPTISVCMTKTKKLRSESQVVKAQFCFESDTLMEDIRVRLDDAVRSMDELAEEEGFEYADSPRCHRRQPWESFL